MRIGMNLFPLTSRGGGMRHYVMQLIPWLLRLSEQQLTLFYPANLYTDGWQAVYDHRTASERSFARELYHLGLDRTRTRGGDRWFFRFLVTAIAHYLIAWHQHRTVA